MLRLSGERLGITEEVQWDKYQVPSWEKLKGNEQKKEIS